MGEEDKKHCALDSLQLLKHVDMYVIAALKLSCRPEGTYELLLTSTC